MTRPGTGQDNHLYSDLLWIFEKNTYSWLLQNDIYNLFFHFRLKI